MKPLEERTRWSEGAPPRHWGVALVIVVVAFSLGTQPAISGDAAQDAQPSTTTGRVRPLDFVKSSVAQVLAAVRLRPATSSEIAQRRAEIRRVADGFFDFNEMARLTLSRHWSAQSPEEQEEFVRLFTALVERSYLSTIENYAGARISFLSESINGTHAQLSSRITTNRRMETALRHQICHWERL